MTYRQCVIEECEGRVVGRGYCRKHYSRWDRYGDPLYLSHPQRNMHEDERFWTYVDKRGPDECWPWTGSISDRGYGKCRHSVSRMAARVAYYLTNGYVPESTDHECHNTDALCIGGDADPHRRCCNPAHLVDRSFVDNAAEAKRTRGLCSNGHLVVDDGTRWGCYRCEQCYRNAKARANERQVAKRAGGPGKAWRTGVQTDACVNGHPWTEDSHKVYQGKRQCIACRKVRAHERWLRIKAERAAAQ